ncbi:MAG: discoidin domain-containing protein [Archangiaceae bacterium]|nr:discoidin domain-containing protein [Archangiaceae bacterium]
MEAQGNPPQSSFERQQSLLIGVTLGTLLGLAAVANARVALHRDLARNASWRTSSTFAVCQPAAHSCASAPTDIFFHTQEEDSPWLELDLKEPRTFSEVRVVNRSDCCAERAQPLVVELSDDAKQWREVARHDQVFSLWSARFASQTARYVRLRVPRKTAFHLVSVQVYR